MSNEQKALIVHSIVKKDSPFFEELGVSVTNIDPSSLYETIIESKYPPLSCFIIFHEFVEQMTTVFIESSQKMNYQFFCIHSNFENIQHKSPLYYIPKSRNKNLRSFILYYSLGFNQLDLWDNYKLGIDFKLMGPPSFKVKSIREYLLRMLDGESFLSENIIYIFLIIDVLERINESFKSFYFGLNQDLILIVCEISNWGSTYLKDLLLRSSAVWIHEYKNTTKLSILLGQKGKESENYPDPKFPMAIYNGEGNSQKKITCYFSSKINIEEVLNISKKNQLNVEFVKVELNQENFLNQIEELSKGLNVTLLVPYSILNKEFNFEEILNLNIELACFLPQGKSPISQIPAFYIPESIKDKNDFILDLFPKS